jgi:AcrR family transcriptional regulator
MMRTKDKIINKAIELYNERGFSNVSSRDIAQDLNMSHGNLEYHYKNKEEILHAIYARMKSEVTEYFSEIDPSREPFRQFDILLKKLDHFQSKYLFFNLDIIEISRQFPKLKKKVETTIQIRKDQMNASFQLFIDNGYIRKEPNAGYYQRLQHKIRVLITFWISQEMILKNFDPTQKISMSHSIWDLLLPHLTEKGAKAYKKLQLETQLDLSVN